METYLVVFTCLNEISSKVEINMVFYSDCPADLCEQIMEYQEDIEDTTELIVVSKTIREIRDG